MRSSEFTKTSYGNEYLTVDGFKFRKKSTYYNKNYWCCVNLTKTKCMAKIHTVGSEIVQKKGEHNHGAHVRDTSIALQYGNDSAENFIEILNYWSQYE